ncbi:hypothetical protein CEXT_599991 [Caerostris extrusa]|uniref:Uncharacterized protein n=1 Tax=Caerostris extrusa TaxID=172846 RepID=A0AAV4RHW4_CAEEX|nr:hypothetical protein CEXT_599991 [Caerostris extrusa]
MNSFTQSNLIRGTSATPDLSSKMLHSADEQIKLKNPSQYSGCNKTSNEISNPTPTPTPWSLQRDTSLGKYRLGSLAQNRLWDANEMKCVVQTQRQLNPHWRRRSQRVSLPLNDHGASMNFGNIL